MLEALDLDKKNRYLTSFQIRRIHALQGLDIIHRHQQGQILAKAHQSKIKATALVANIKVVLLTAQTMLDEDDMQHFTKLNPLQKRDEILDVGAIQDVFGLLIHIIFGTALIILVFSPPSDYCVARIPKKASSFLLQQGIDRQ